MNDDFWKDLKVEEEDVERVAEFFRQTKQPASIEHLTMQLIQWRIEEQRDELPDAMPSRVEAKGRKHNVRAKVTAQEGKGQLLINGEPAELYFEGNCRWRHILFEPFECANLSLNGFDVKATVTGRNRLSTRQPRAIAHALAGALTFFDPNLKRVLRKEGFRWKLVPPRQSQSVSGDDPHDVFQKHCTRLARRLAAELEARPDEFVSFETTWLLRELLLTVNDEHLAKVEAAIRKANEAQNTDDLCRVIFPAASSNEAKFLQRFSLNLALGEQSDRFKQVAPDRWHLTELLDALVFVIPPRLANPPVRSDRDVVFKEEYLDQLAEDLRQQLQEATDAGMEDEEGVEEDTRRTRFKYVLPLNHYLTGTLPVAAAGKGFFPDDHEIAEVWFTDASTNQRFRCWVNNRPGYGLVYGLRDWYEKNMLPAGAIFYVDKADRRGEYKIFFRDAPAAWRQITFHALEEDPTTGRLRSKQETKRVLCEVDPLRYIEEQRLLDLDLLKKEADQVGKSIFDIMADVMEREHPNDAVHYVTLFTEVNVIRRTNRRTVASILSAYACFYQQSAEKDTGKWRYDPMRKNEPTREEVRRWIERQQNREKPVRDTPTQQKPTNTVILSLDRDANGIPHNPRRGDKLGTFAFNAILRDEFRIPILKVLMDYGGRCGLATILDELESRMQHLFTNEDMKPPSEGYRFQWQHRAAWALQKLKMSGEVENVSRGMWTMTEAGLDHLRDVGLTSDVSPDAVQEVIPVSDVPTLIATKMFRCQQCGEETAVCISYHRYNEVMGSHWHEKATYTCKRKVCRHRWTEDIMRFVREAWV